MEESLNLVGKIYKNLKNQILDGELQPRQHIYETDLAKEFNVSRAPIREAFAKLIQDKFVYAIQRKGVFVASITKKEIEDIYEIRKTIELLAVEKSIGRFPLDKLEKNINELIKFKKLPLNSENKLKYLSIDRKFHYLLFKNCNNNRLTDLLIHFQEHMKRFQKYALNIKSFHISIKEHIDIVESIKKNNKTLIKRNLLKHLKRVEKSYFYQFME